MALRQFISFVLVATALGCGGSSVNFIDESDTAPVPECSVKKHDTCDVPNAPMCGGSFTCCAWSSGEMTWEEAGKCPVSPASPPSDSGSPSPSGDAGPDTTPPPSDTGSAEIATPDTTISDTGTVADSGSPDSEKTDTGLVDTGSFDAGVTSDSGTPDTLSDAGTDTGTVVDSTPPPSPPTTGKLVVNVRLSRWGSHAITMMGFENPIRTGGPMWGSPTWTATGNGVEASVNVAPSSEFEFTGFYDPAKPDDWTNSFVDYKTGAIRVLHLAQRGDPNRRREFFHAALERLQLHHGAELFQPRLVLGGRNRPVDCVAVRGGDARQIGLDVQL